MKNLFLGIIFCASLALASGCMGHKTNDQNVTDTGATSGNISTDSGGIKHDSSAMKGDSAKMKDSTKGK